MLTRDGSHSISVPELNAFYHSIHGAIQESMHVFIRAGFRHYHSDTSNKAVSILEVGMGTGLNVLLTLLANEKQQSSVAYTALEPFPLDPHITSSLNFCETMDRQDLAPVFQQIHEQPWSGDVNVMENFTLKKLPLPLLEASLPADYYDIVYFDAFAPSAQAEMWSAESFLKLYEAIKPGGFLVTYCSKTVIRRAMEAAGFRVTKIPGPYGKREMVRAFRGKSSD